MSNNLIEILKRLIDDTDSPLAELGAYDLARAHANILALIPKKMFTPCSSSSEVARAYQNGFNDCIDLITSMLGDK
jgi:hypothetical protein